jgi:hypothetical protein
VLRPSPAAGSPAGGVSPPVVEVPAIPMSSSWKVSSAKGRYLPAQATCTAKMRKLTTVRLRVLLCSAARGRRVPKEHWHGEWLICLVCPRPGALPYPRERRAAIGCAG